MTQLTVRLGLAMTCERIGVQSELSMFSTLYRVIDGLLLY